MGQPFPATLIYFFITSDHYSSFYVVAHLTRSWSILRPQGMNVLNLDTIKIVCPAAYNLKKFKLIRRVREQPNEKPTVNIVLGVLTFDRHLLPHHSESGQEKRTWKKINWVTCNYRQSPELEHTRQRDRATAGQHFFSVCICLTWVFMICISFFSSPALLHLFMGHCCSYFRKQCMTIITIFIVGRQFLTNGYLNYQPNEEINSRR